MVGVTGIAEKVIISESSWAFNKHFYIVLHEQSDKVFFNIIQSI